jgi:3-deoxy-7-phosphoheptulonate synthase
MLWVGDRTRQPASAHVEFLRGIANPIGIKCGPTLDADTLLALCHRLDPDREPGRLTLIVRLGADRIANHLPALLRAVRGAGRSPLWLCDPMHGNTRFEDGRKVRRMPDMIAEALAFHRLCAAHGVWPGGLHLELSADPVRECRDANDPPALDRPACDPRLNPDQATALVAAVAALRQSDVAA